MTRRGAIVALLSMALWLQAGESAGHDPNQTGEHSGHPQGKPAESSSVERTKVSPPDLPVLTQDGKPVWFYSDLIRGRVVAVNFIYTTCTTVCPLLGVVFSQAQDLLGDRLGREVFLVSISVDPVVDTPQRLKAWGAKFGFKPGWTMVTGKKADIDKLLRAFGVYTTNKDDHPPTVFIGDEPHGQWTRAYGLIPPTQLVGLLEAALAQPPTATSAGK